MLETIAIVLIILWLLGLVSSNTMGGFIHILLVVAIVVILLRLIQGRRAWGWYSAGCNAVGSNWQQWWFIIKHIPVTSTSTNKMHKKANGIQENVENIVDDTRALIAATKDVAEDGVMEARRRLTAAMDAAKDAYELVQKRAIKSAKVADHMVRENPYKAVGIALGVGIVLGFLCARRR
jgi:ElaB/YqjD/DUF883 family membrane-anchored ribosome-binding protein